MGRKPRRGKQRRDLKLKVENRFPNSSSEDILRRGTVENEGGVYRRFPVPLLCHDSLPGPALWASLIGFFMDDI